MNTYEYAHGGNIRYKNPGIIDFSANINPLGPPEGVIEAIREAGISAYPDQFSSELRAALGRFEGVNEDNIICSGGASDIIFRLAYAIKPKTGIITAPAFSDYERALRASGCDNIIMYKLHEDQGFEIMSDFPDFIVSQKPELVYICNPNNPTGVLTSGKLMERIIEACAEIGCIIAVDECFIDFAKESAGYTVKGLTARYPNLIVIKAFTKIFAIPGLRLGYAICGNKSLINKLYFHGPDWSVSSVAQAAGLAALKDPAPYISKTIDYIESEKEKFKSLGINIFGSMANYVFFKNPNDIDLAQVLQDKYNIYVRSCANYHGLNRQFIRAAILAPHQNYCLTAAIKEILEDRICP